MKRVLVYAAAAVMLSTTPALAAADDTSAAAMFVTWLIITACYFFPSIVAFLRGHHQVVPIFLTNLFFGWTVIGWIGALIWSASAITYRRLT
ncbi:superinfection immunity protein [Bradyrhizobium sp. AUGA SZCCT0042]|uniref:superinfection immunity protein n=1 Tax=Bradyrhizobium sp. AUGA SZCCT0042 TaxID=2807651 RepID=UPI001BA744CB|nr:superinfection immunity protein [Bradyrhizobium sp. AUGA SZCCT0042]MBR1302165.1 superinfection immunity protein [Bradyrhizobium sp. AUGA SZCCT0042]